MAKKRGVVSDKPIIRLQDVWKVYHVGSVEVNALRGLTLSISEQEFVSIMGPSGSGKSTAMNMVGCLDVPTTGEIYLEQLNIEELEESELAQIRGQKIGFVFQKFNLINTLTALENVALPMVFQEVNREERNRRAEALLTKVGLSDRMNHRPSELSGGQQQRVAVARALVNDPEVILADEPTGNLDTRSGTEIMSLLIDLHKKEKKTIILVTHDKDVAEYADRIEYLVDGRIEKTLKK
jgi:putative ABC transport system ATP-binding protein